MKDEEMNRGGEGVNTSMPSGSGNLSSFMHRNINFPVMFYFNFKKFALSSGVFVKTCSGPA